MTFLGIGGLVIGVMLGELCLVRTAAAGSAETTQTKIARALSAGPEHHSGCHGSRRGWTRRVDRASPGNEWLDLHAWKRIRNRHAGDV